MSLFLQGSHLRQVAGINIHLLSNGEADIDACVIRIEKKALLITKKLPGLASLNALKAHIQPRMPVAVNITGRGILIKEVGQPAALTPARFQAILPNADRNDFYIQQFISGEKQFVALFRRSEGDTWLQKLEQLSFLPLTLSLGAFPVANILSQVNTYGTTFSFNGHNITLNEDQQWETYQPNSDQRSAFPLKIESETIAESLLIPYAAAFQLALHNKVEAIKAEVPSLSERLAKQVDGQALKKKGLLALMVFFLLLLGNFFILMQLTNTNQKLSQQAIISDNNTKSFQEISADIARAESRLAAAGWDGGNCKSCLISQLAALLPSSVTLQSIQVNPPDVRVSRETGFPAFAAKKIVVTGTTSRMVDLNEWMAMIKAKKLVHDIKLLDYKFNTELNTGEFSMEIDY